MSLATDTTALPLDKIRADGGTQPRERIDDAVVNEYAEDMRGGATFPPVVVFYDGTEYWLADGFHRCAAADVAGLESVPADVRQGTRRDAVLFSVGANAQHGWRRSNADKRRAVTTLLNDAEWSAWSNREIAKRCGVDETLVRKLRPDVSAVKPQIAPGPAPSPPTRKVQRNGTVYTMQMPPKVTPPAPVEVIEITPAEAQAILADSQCCRPLNEAVNEKPAEIQAPLVPPQAPVQPPAPTTTLRPERGAAIVHKLLVDFRTFTQSWSQSHINLNATGARIPYEFGANADLQSLEVLYDSIARQFSQHLRLVRSELTARGLKEKMEG